METVRQVTTIKGRFKRRLWGNDQQYRISLYSLVDADDDAPAQVQTDKTFVAKGDFLPENETLITRLTGRWVKNKNRDGYAFQVQSFFEEPPSSKEGIIKYLSSGLYKGIGPKTASELAISIDIEDFPSHDRLASYCGLAPRNRQSGTSISSVTASRQGNKRLKNLLIFSCNCLTRTEGRWGDYYTRCRERGMPHGKALKALARKRLKVIYAIMRDRVPYAA